MKTLVVAEKASIANTLRSVLPSDKFIITHASGHLFAINTELLADNKWMMDVLPYLPRKNDFKLTVTRPKLLSDIRNAYISNKDQISKIINFCDAAQEGELIFRYISENLNFPENIIYRAWPKALTDHSIKETINTAVKQEKYNSLYEAALARAHTDWKFGINLSRACSIHYRSKSLIGRVKTPILYIIYKRYFNHKNHKVTTHYNIKAKNTSLPLVATSTDNYSTESDANNAFSNLDRLKIINVVPTSKNVAPPKPYNLNDLQIDASKYFKLSPEQTLSVVQELYENKYVSYPRTDSNYFMEDQKDEINRILSTFNNPHIAIENSLKLFDNSKVSDHYAIYPLTNYPSTDTNDIKFKIYHLILMRLLVAFSHKHTFTSYKIDLVADNDSQLPFNATHKEINKQGWHDTISNYPALSLKAEKDESNTSLDVEKLEINSVHDFEFSSNKVDSKPKPLHTYSSLLKILENINSFYKEEEIELSGEELNAIKEAKGIGTPATRGSIINQLVDKGFIEEKANKLIPSVTGIALMQNIESLSLASPSFSADMELKLSKIRSNQLNYDSYFSTFDKSMKSYIEEIKNSKIVNQVSERTQLNHKCPSCESFPIQLKYNYKCQCGLINIPVELCKKKISPKLAEEILTKESKALSFVSQKGNKFKAKIIYDFDKKKVSFNFVNT